MEHYNSNIYEASSHSVITSGIGHVLIEKTLTIYAVFYYITESGIPGLSLLTGKVLVFIYQYLSLIDK